uniref:DUF3536 domain-containing protein n=1 Tax=Candidatus Methanomethylicus mesodigestus TaxID=1867258 RepID=A0A7C3ES57_9CREN
MSKFVCIHGHFYQPPRENPWLEEIELQESARPYHDWNARIASECYAPNAASRIVDKENKIVDIVNNYTKMSFDFGPTLLSWLERHDAELYRTIIESDRVSSSRFSGHGSAMALAYNHMILPLASRRDKETQIRWGIADFRKRFNRLPEGMWLPETAVDYETLDLLSEAGVKFTVLSPLQASKVRVLGSETWTDVAGGKIDTTVPYLCSLPSGREISVFFFNQPISNDVAFGNLLSDGKSFAERLVSAARETASPALVSVATDGETYGHHHKFGDMALAYCIHYIESNGLARITNFGEFLEISPPTSEVQIIENSSWSCAHGVERWRSDCGCNTGICPSQKWRGPLREAADWLRDELDRIYVAEASKCLVDPWASRDDYISVVMDRSPEALEAFLKKNSRSALGMAERQRALKCLEMQRHRMLMYTSCGWFYDDISGIEAVQVIRSAARAIQLAEELSAASLEGEYVRRLASAKSNLESIGDGAKLYASQVKPSSVDLMKVGMHYAISSAFSKEREGRVYCYSVKDEFHNSLKSGRLCLIVGKSKVTSEILLEAIDLEYAILWLGDHNVYGSIREAGAGSDFARMYGELREAFKRGEVYGILSIMDQNFKGGKCAPCSLRNLFKDKQIEIVSKILEASVSKANDFYSEVFSTNQPALLFLKSIGMDPPKALQAAAEVVLSSKMLEALRAPRLDLEEFSSIVDDVKALQIEIDRDAIGLEATRRIEGELKEFANDPDDLKRIEALSSFLTILKRLSLPLNLWRAQNTVFSIIKGYYGYLQERRMQDSYAASWSEAFERLCSLVGVKA